MMMYKVSNVLKAAVAARISAGDQNYCRCKIDASENVAPCEVRRNPR